MKPFTIVLPARAPERELKFFDKSFPSAIRLGPDEIIFKRQFEDIYGYTQINKIDLTNYNMEHYTNTLIKLSKVLKNEKQILGLCLLVGRIFLKTVHMIWGLNSFIFSNNLTSRNILIQEKTMKILNELGKINNSSQTILFDQEFDNLKEFSNTLKNFVKQCFTQQKFTKFLGEQKDLNGYKIRMNSFELLHSGYDISHIYKWTESIHG